MQQWLGYVDRYSVEGLLKKWPNTDYRNWYLGDWATPEGVGDPNHEDERSVDLVNNCYISVCLSQMEDIATVLGKEDDKKLYSEKRSQLNKKIHDTFYNVEEGYYATGSQIDIIFPMISGVAPAELKDQLTEILIEKTEKEYDGHLNTGLVGIPVMMEWAATANEPGFVYSMLKKKTYPGYLYMLENGATTTWEHWNGERSRIHNCYNGVGQWFYQVVGGIRPVRGEKAYKKFIIQPQIPNGVTWARTSQETPYGEISVNWKLQDEKMKMNIRVPVGSTGILQYPEGTTEIKINSKTITITGNQLELESGKHTVEYLL
jgi:alpha-L-rhamnosidase